MNDGIWVEWPEIAHLRGVSRLDWSHPVEYHIVVLLIYQNGATIIRYPYMVSHGDYRPAIPLIFLPLTQPGAARTFSSICCLSVQHTRVCTPTRDTVRPAIHVVVWLLHMPSVRFVPPDIDQLPLAFRHRSSCAVLRTSSCQCASSQLTTFVACNIEENSYTDSCWWALPCRTSITINAIDCLKQPWEGRLVGSKNVVCLTPNSSCLLLLLRIRMHILQHPIHHR